MTWIEERRAWTAKYKKKKYTVSCKQLQEDGWSVRDCTKEGSRTAAAGWWKQKRRHIDNEEAAARQRQIPPPTPAQRMALNFLGKPTSEWENEVEAELANTGDIKVAREVFDFLAEMVRAELISTGKMPETVKQHMPAQEVEELERAARVIRQERVEMDKTVSGQVKRFLEDELVRVRAGQLSDKKYAEKKHLLGIFVDHLTPAKEVKEIDEETVRRWALYCQGRMKEAGGTWGKYRAQDAFRYGKEFIVWAAEYKLCPLPANIHKRFRFEEEVKDLDQVRWTEEEFSSVLKQTRGSKLRLFLLLMANCGFTQKDISDLKKGEINWEAGTITRRRSKTKRKANTPRVTYPLWPETLELLRNHDSKQDRVLLTETGKPYVLVWTDQDGKKHEKDEVKNLFHGFLKRTGLDFGKPLKGLRKMSSTLVEDMTSSEALSTYFLGQSPTNIKNRHYVEPTQDKFNRVVLELGRRLGQVPAEATTPA
jgi:integrase